MNDESRETNKIYYKETSFHSSSSNVLLMNVIKCLFSNAAATLSLSASCLLIESAETWVPGVTSTVTLNRGGSVRSSLTLIESPISVAMLQWGMVGVKKMWILLPSLSTSTLLSSTTCSSSSVRGCSGSRTLRIRSEKSGLFEVPDDKDLQGAPTKDLSLINWIDNIFVELVSGDWTIGAAFIHAWIDIFHRIWVCHHVFTSFCLKLLRKGRNLQR